MDVKLKHIIGKLKSTRGLESFHLLMNGLFYFLSILLISILIISFFETIARGDVTFRTVLFFFFLLISVLAFSKFLLSNILRFFGLKYLPDIHNIALRVGEVYPDIKDKLSNAIQTVDEHQEAHNTSGTLANAYFADVYNISNDKDFNRIINRERTKKTALLFLFILLFVSTIFVFFTGSLTASIERIINFRKDYIPPAPFTLDIEPVYKKVTRGEHIDIIIEAKGVAPESIVLNIKEQQQDEFETLNLKADSNGTYVYKLSSVKTSLSYFAESTWMNTTVKSQTGAIQVIDRPIIRSISGLLSYPSYTGLESFGFNEQNADISSIRGTKSSFTVFAGSLLSSAEIVMIFEDQIVDSNTNRNQVDTNIVKMKVTKNQAAGYFIVKRTCKYFFRLIDTNGIENESPIEYSCIALDDEYPEIDLEQPLNNVQVNENALLPIIVSISDDYGFSYLKLNYKLVKSKYADPDKSFSAIEIPITSNSLTLQVPYLWDLNEINITPEDVYEFYLEIFDNDIVNGPKSARTKTLAVRLPSLDEVLESADDMQKKIQEDVKELLKKTEEVKKEMEKMNRELIQKPKNAQLDWKEKKNAEDLLKKQNELQSKMNDIKKQMSELTNKLQENQAISPETLEKYMELQKLMQEVSSPELKRLQEQMQKALDKMDPAALKKAMENAKFNEEQFRKSLERTIKLLKRLQAEQKADAVQKRADELLKKQEDLNKRTENTNPADKKKTEELSKEQDNLKKELENLGKDLKELEDLMKEINENMPLQELENAKMELNQQETSSEMQNASSKMKKSEMNKAGKSQKKAASNLRKFSEAMKNMKKKMQNNISKEAIKKMQKSLNDIIELSKEQEALKQQTKNTDYNSTQIPGLAQKQAQIQEGLKNVANSMMALSEKSFAVTPEMGQQIGNAMQQMENAQKNLANRSVNSSAASQTNAMESMNKAAAQMQSMLNSMKSSDGSCNNPGGEGQGKGSGISFSQKMREAAQQQQGINNSMQQMMGNMPRDGGLTPEQQAELGRIAKEQGKARKAIEELAREQKEFGGERKSLGNLNKIAQEMEEVVSDLENNNITPETLDKQERILSRLLDASVSMNERDYEKKRESKSGTQFRRNSPSSLNFDENDTGLKSYREMMNALKLGYSKDYEILIRKYFETLQNANR